DDGSTVYVERRLVVDNGGRHPVRLATGTIHLARGAHPLLLYYFQDGGEFELELLWARDGSPLEPVPAWALRPRAAGPVQIAAGWLLAVVLPPLEWIWVGSLVLAAAVLLQPAARRLIAALRADCEWPWLRAVLGGSLALNAVGIWWGLPGRWAPIEMQPLAVFVALSRRFSHGWFEAYPPFQYYLLTAAMSPLLLLERLGRLSLGTLAADTAILAMYRIISLLAALGLLMAVCICGTKAFGRRAGVFAAAIMALAPPFVYYAKTANVDMPYMFWFAVSLIFYLRILDGGTMRDFVLFAVFGMLSICTKDQAYGLYLAAPAVILVRLWQLNRCRGLERPLWSAVSDRRLTAAAAAGGAVFAVCHNLPFNTDGFVDHVRLITGGMSQSYRLFEPTLEGHARLLALTGSLIQQSLGWPLLAAGVCGLALGLASTRRRAATLWLAAPVVSYYVGFIDVVLYNYDRFVLPMCLALALYGGLALDRFLAAGAGRKRWRRLAVGVVFAYSLAYAGTVDVLMLADSRYEAERWLAARVGPGERIGVTELAELLPRLDAFRTVEVATIADLQRERPEYFVLNADYARAAAPDSAWGRLLTGLEREALGYRRLVRFRTRGPWFRLPGGHPDLIGPRTDTPVTSVLRDINPTIDVFRRDDLSEAHPASDAASMRTASP